MDKIIVKLNNIKLLGEDNPQQGNLTHFCESEMYFLREQYNLSSRYDTGAAISKLGNLVTKTNKPDLQFEFNELCSYMRKKKPFEG
jgi:hypothetical protein